MKTKLLAMVLMAGSTMFAGVRFGVGVGFGGPVVVAQPHMPRSRLCLDQRRLGRTRLPRRILWKTRLRQGRLLWTPRRPRLCSRLPSVKIKYGWQRAVGRRHALPFILSNDSGGRPLSNLLNRSLRRAR